MEVSTNSNSNQPPSTLQPAADPFKQPSADVLFGSKAPAAQVQNVCSPVLAQPRQLAPIRSLQNDHVINVGQPRPATPAPRIHMVSVLNLRGPVNEKTPSNIPIEQCPILKVNAQYVLKVLTNHAIEPRQVAFQVRKNGQDRITRTIQLRITIQHSRPRPGHIAHITFAMNEALWSRYEVLRISIKNKVLMDDIVVVQDGNAINSLIKSICLSQASGKNDFQMRQLRKLPWFDGLVTHLKYYASLKALT